MNSLVQSVKRVEPPPHAFEQIRHPALQLVRPPEGGETVRQHVVCVGRSAQLLHYLFYG